MISRKNRFHGYGSLKYVYKNGRTVRGPLFALKSVDNQKRTSYRLAVVVSRKVNKSAVVRNRIRRRLYEGVRILEEEMTQPKDMVLTVFSDAVLNEPWPKLTKMLKKQLGESGVIASKKQA